MRDRLQSRPFCLRILLTLSSYLLLIMISKWQIFIAVGVFWLTDAELTHTVNIKRLFPRCWLRCCSVCNCAVGFHWSLLTRGMVSWSDVTCLLVSLSLPESPRAKYTGRARRCGHCNVYRAYVRLTAWDEIREHSFDCSLQPIITPWLLAKHIFAECECIAHRKHASLSFSN